MAKVAGSGGSVQRAGGGKKPMGRGGKQLNKPGTPPKQPKKTPKKPPKKSGGDLENAAKAIPRLKKHENAVNKLTNSIR